MLIQKHKVVRIGDKAQNGLALHALLLRSREVLRITHIGKRRNGELNIVV